MKCPSGKLQLLRKNEMPIISKKRKRRVMLSAIVWECEKKKLQSLFAQGKVYFSWIAKF